MILDKIKDMFSRPDTGEKTATNTKQKDKIGKDEVRKAFEILKKYKSAKANLEKKIV